MNRLMGMSRAMRVLTMIWWSCGLLAALPAQAEEVAGPAHKVVYQCNKGGEADYKSLLFSVSAMKEKYGDDIDIVVVCHGPGIHLLAKHPKRYVPEDVQEKMSYLDTFGVKFHACGNTMKGYGWHEEDMLDFAEVVEIGADDLMLLQEQGYTYLSW